jgi:DNA gyrase subunit B
MIIVKILEIDKPMITVQYASKEIIRINMKNYLSISRDHRLTKKILSKEGFESVKISLGCLSWFGVGFNPDEMYRFSHERGDGNIVETIRKRPGMYTGSTSEDGVVGSISGVIEDLLKETFKPEMFIVVLHPDDSISITSDACFTKLEGLLPFESAKLLAEMTIGFDNDLIYSSPYFELIVAICLSSSLSLELATKESMYTQRFQRGEPKGGVIEVPRIHSFGTSVHFKLDSEIFYPASPPPDRIGARLRELSYLFPSVEFRFVDHINRSIAVFEKNLGMVSCLIDEIKSKYPKFDDPYVIYETLVICEDKVELQIAAQIVEVGDGKCLSFVNDRSIPKGSHVIGALKGCGNFFEETEDFSQLKERLALAIKVKIVDPSFQGPDRLKLLFPDLEKRLSVLIPERFLEIDKKRRMTAQEFDLRVEDEDVSRYLVVIEKDPLG